MIKIIIKEQATRAGTAAAGSQAIKSYYNPNQTKTKAKTKEATPVTDTESSQPQQQPEETKPKGIVPSNWKPEIGTEIELKGVKYKANSTGGWLPNGIGFPILKTSPIFSTLNTLAYNEEQNKKSQSTSTTVPLDPQEAPTEEASTPVTVQEVSDEINYPDLLSQVGDYFDFTKQDNVINFIDKTVEFLQSNENFKSIYEQIENQIEQLSLGIFNDQRKQQRIKDLTNDLIGAADDLAGLVTEVIDPITGLSILLGTISLGTLIGGLNYKRLRAKSNQTPEGRYLFLLGLEVKLLIVKSIIDGNDVTDIQNLITTKIKPDLEEFKKPSLNLFKQKKLLNQKNKQLEGLAGTVARLIKQKADDQSPSVGLNESTINRWKLIAGIRG